ncbi:unnamed protein product [Closterium sp. NIES-53]
MEHRCIPWGAWSRGSPWGAIVRARAADLGILQPAGGGEGRIWSDRTQSLSFPPPTCSDPLRSLSPLSSPPSSLTTPSSSFHSYSPCSLIRRFLETQGTGVSTTTTSSSSGAASLAPTAGAWCSSFSSFAATPHFPPAPPPLPPPSLPPHPAALASAAAAVAQHAAPSVELEVAAALLNDDHDGANDAALHAAVAAATNDADDAAAFQESPPVITAGESEWSAGGASTAMTDPLGLSWAATPAPAPTAGTTHPLAPGSPVLPLSFNPFSPPPRSFLARPSYIPAQLHSRVTDPHSLITNPHSLVTNPHSLVTDPHNLITEHHSLITEPKNLVTEPHGLVTEPTNLDTDPHGLITDPHGLVTDPHGLITEPHSLVTDPHSPITDPHGLVTNPHGPITDAQVFFTVPHSMAPLPQFHHALLTCAPASHSSPAMPSPFTPLAAAPLQDVTNSPFFCLPRLPPAMLTANPSASLPLAASSHPSSRPSSSPASLPRLPHAACPASAPGVQRALLRALLRSYSHSHALPTLHSPPSLLNAIPTAPSPQRHRHSTIAPAPSPQRHRHSTIAPAPSPQHHRPSTIPTAAAGAGFTAAAHPGATTADYEWMAGGHTHCSPLHHPLPPPPPPHMRSLAVPATPLSRPHGSAAAAGGRQGARRQVWAGKQGGVMDEGQQRAAFIDSMAHYLGLPSPPALTPAAARSAPPTSTAAAAAVAGAGGGGGEVGEGCVADAAGR